MKKCNYCGTVTKYDNSTCDRCGGNDFINVCDNCGSTFDGGYCPVCGVKPGSKPK
ncbi:MAG: hypothetical protein IJT91_05780 [Clostridia bacterium]|nr:hypothetical protein [Clostridia bacterium]